MRLFRIEITRLLFISGIIFLTGCSVKFASNSFNEEFVDNSKQGNPYEIEIELPFAKDSNSDFSFSISNQDFVWEPDVSLLDTDITWRYHFEKKGLFNPYAGVGFGYYKLQSKTKVDNCPSGYFCYGPGFVETKTRNLVSGYNPHLLIGTLIPIGDSGHSLVIEGKYEVAKEKNGQDLNSNSILVGIRFWH